MLIAELFITAKILKQSICPSTSEKVNNRWYIYIMKYYSAKQMKQGTDIFYNMDGAKKHYAK